MTYNVRCAAFALLGSALSLAACSSPSAQQCLASTPPTTLYEDYCPAGQTNTVCLFDHPKMDGY